MNRRILFLTLCFWLTLLICGGCATPNSTTQQDQDFETLYGQGVTFDRSKLELTPDNTHFHTQGDWISFSVYNHTGKDLVFKDNSFGVRGFTFDGTNGWREIDLGFRVGQPGQVVLRNGAVHPDEVSTAFPTETLDAQGYTWIRLLVVGCSIGTAVEPNCEKFGAYADIKLIEGPKGK